MFAVRSSLLLAAGAALVLATVACSTNPGTPPTPSGSAGTRAAAQGGGASPATTDAAEVLRFTAPRLGGGTVDGRDLAGRDVAFWFWAPW